MKQRNKVGRLRARQVEYDEMLRKADSLEELFLAKAHKRPGSLNK